MTMLHSCTGWTMSGQPGYIILSLLQIGRPDDHGIDRFLASIMWVCLKMLCTPKPNGFADHYPY